MLYLRILTDQHFLVYTYFFICTAPYSNTRWAKIIFLRCQTPEVTNIYFPPIEWPHIQNCHHSPLLDACWLLYCSSLTGLASGKMVEPDIVSTGQYQYSTLNSRWIRSTNSQEHHNRCVHPFLYTPPWAQISPFSLNWCITLKSTCPPARPFLVRSNYGKQGLCWNKQPPPNLPPTR